MKRNLLRTTALFLAAVLCGAWLTGCGQPAGSTGSSAPASSAAAAAPILAPEDIPRLDGSTACIPLMAQMLHETTGISLEEAESTITVSTTGYAWLNMLYPEMSTAPQLLLVYEAPEYIQQQVEQSDVKLEVKPIGRDALVFLANEANPVNNLTTQQLLNIYGGQTTNWQQVGGADAPIVAYQRSEDSGSQTMFRKLLMKDNPLMDAPSHLAPGDMGELVDEVASYNNTANALGFSVYYYIEQMYSQPGLKLMSVDGVAPTDATIEDRSYPLCNEFFAVIRADAAADSPERLLFDWLTTDAGAQCLRTAGYVPAR